MSSSIRSCNHKYLRRQVRMLRDAVAPLIRDCWLRKSGELRRAPGEARQMAHFFRLGDGERVAELCRNHCAYTGTALIEKFLTNGTFGS